MLPTVRSGKLRHRVSVERRSGTRGAFNQPTESYTEIGKLWVSVEPASGKESATNDQLFSVRTFKLRAHGGPAIALELKATDRLRWLTIKPESVLQITSTPAPVMGRLNQVEFEAVEVRNG